MTLSSIQTTLASSSNQLFENCYHHRHHQDKAGLRQGRPCWCLGWIVSDDFSLQTNTHCIMIYIYICIYIIIIISSSSPSSTSSPCNVAISLGRLGNYEHAVQATFRPTLNVRDAIHDQIHCHGHHHQLQPNYYLQPFQGEAQHIATLDFLVIWVLKSMLLYGLPTRQSMQRPNEQ